MWMITQEPLFLRSLTGSQKNPVLVIETGTFYRIVIRRNYDQLVTGPCQLPWVFEMLELSTTVTAS